MVKNLQKHARKEVIDTAAEKQFENKIKNFLKKEGAWLIKYWAGAPYTKAGVPDILACINGRFLGIEIKARGGRPSELQIYNLHQIDNAGGIAILLYPDDYEGFVLLVRAIQSGDDVNVWNAYKAMSKRWKEIDKCVTKLESC